MCSDGYVETRNLPTWDECAAKEELSKLTPIEDFIYKYESNGTAYKEWRDDLANALSSAGGVRWINKD